MLIAFKGYGHYVEHAFHASVWRSLSALEVSSCRLDDVSLLGPIHIVLRWRLYAHPAGLDLYKMYSIDGKGNDVDFQMPASPVSFQDCVSHTLKQAARNILAPVP